MKTPTFIAGSFPKIVTSGKTRRKNEEAINDPFIRDYINLLGELLLVKKELKDIKIIYMGGYQGIENINTAKLYLSAFNYLFKQLGYGELSKNNFQIIEQAIYEEKTKETITSIENADLIILGIGSDYIFGNLLNKFSMDGVVLRDIINRNNILVTSICAGSVLSANKIYGGNYDVFYDNSIPFQYPDNYPTLNFNIVTMETNLYPEAHTDDENKTFTQKYLLPDSYSLAFFGCRQNSCMIMNNEELTAMGEIYLFIDGEILNIVMSNDKVDIKILNSLVNEYNKTRDILVKEKIKFEIKNLKKRSNLDSYKNYLEQEEKDMLKKRSDKKRYLEQFIYMDIIKLLEDSDNERINKDKLGNKFLDALNLDTDKREELVIKYRLIGVIKRYSYLYQENYRLYFKDLYDILTKFIEINPYIVLYFVECFSSMYDNKDMKKLLELTKLETSRRVNAMNKNNLYFKKFWGCYNGN